MKFRYYENENEIDFDISFACIKFQDSTFELIERFSVFQI